MKKILLILGIVIIIFSGLLIIFRANKSNKLANINPDNFEIKYGEIDKWIDSGINAKNIKEINVVKEENQHKIQIVLDNNGKKIFSDITSKNIGKKIGLFVRGIPVSAPEIQQIIDSGILVITNNFNQEEALTFKNDIVNQAPDPNAFYVIKPVGQSMEQYGSNDGQSVRIYYNQKCVAGDNCYFQCLIDKCACSDSNCILNGGSSKLALKHLISVKDDCYWFEGNADPRIENGIEYKSFDSRAYGCLKSSEFKMFGVAK